MAALLDHHPLDALRRLVDSADGEAQLVGDLRGRPSLDHPLAESLPACRLDPRADPIEHLRLPRRRPAVDGDAELLDGLWTRQLSQAGQGSRAARPTRLGPSPLTPPTVGQDVADDRLQPAP